LAAEREVERLRSEGAEVLLELDALRGRRGTSHHGDGPGEPLEEGSDANAILPETVMDKLAEPRILPDVAMDVSALGEGVASAGGAMSERSRSISVAVRLKPGVPGSSVDWSHDASDWKCLRDERTGETWCFDRVLGPETSTAQLFETCSKDVVESFCNGINGTVLTYGQTASGKTYTMQGDGRVKGVIQLAVDAIFTNIGMQEDTKHIMSVSYLEIYNERIYDLLGDGMEVRVFEHARGDVELQNLTRKRVSSGPNDVLECLEVGSRRRRVGETLANDRSSRSHTVLQIHLESQKTLDSSVRLSQLNLVDLAGSESTKTTGATGKRLREGQNINRSLLALSQVVATLADSAQAPKASRVGFRDSKLTRILQQSIGGNAQTALICTISMAEANYWESRRTLDFASRVKRIKNRISANVFKLSECRLEEMLKLRAENEQLRVHATALSTRLEELRAEGGALRERGLCGVRREPLGDVTNRLTAPAPPTAGVRKRADSGGPCRTAWQH